MRVSELKKKQAQKLAEQKVKSIQKVSNNFIDSTIHKSNLAALKTIYYLATIIHKYDFENEKKDAKGWWLNSYEIDLRDMLKYTGLTAQDIRHNLRGMQETSITFINEKEKTETFVSLIPRIEFHYGKNRIDVDLYSKIAQLIIEVVDKYTFINTAQLMRLKNKHSLRLLPVLYKLSQYDVNMSKQTHYDLGELNDLFGTKYQKIVEIERKILKPVKEELDIESKLSFVYEVDFLNLGQGRPKAHQVTISLVEKNRTAPKLF